VRSIIPATTGESLYVHTRHANSPRLRSINSHAASAARQSVDDHALNDFAGPGMHAGGFGVAAAENRHPDLAMRALTSELVLVI
jgi:hypothetical protein